MFPSSVRFLSLLFLSTLFCSTHALAFDQKMSDIFSERNKTQQVLNIEAALARAQASLDIIPVEAAEELTAKADIIYLPEDALAKEYQKVKHRMVALLNVWQRNLQNGAEQYMHYGATTVDIYDTALVLQLRQATRLLIIRLRDVENAMLMLAEKEANTLMIGRTLGQHALPITFGKKVSTWAAENRRNIERLKSVYLKLERSAILKGAVGSYLGLGDRGIELERRFSEELSLSSNPYADDWHASRDVFAEYGQVLAIISKSYGRIGQELFLLQSTDIAETLEVRKKTVISSSTMPHKNNPSKSEALMHYSRTVPRLAEVMLDDMMNFFERDNTSRPNKVAAEVSIQADDMARKAHSLISQLKVNRDKMRENVLRTKGLIMSQRLAFALAPKLGKTVADGKVHHLAQIAIEENKSLRQTFERSELASLLSKKALNEIFDASSYIGLAKEQVAEVITYIKKERQKEEANLSI